MEKSNLSKLIFYAYNFKYVCVSKLITYKKAIACFNYIPKVYIFKLAKKKIWLKSLYIQNSQKYKINLSWGAPFIQACTVYDA